MKVYAVLGGVAVSFQQTQCSDDKRRVSILHAPIEMTALKRYIVQLDYICERVSAF